MAIAVEPIDDGLRCLFKNQKVDSMICIECESKNRLWNHPSGLCPDCYQLFKQRLRDNEVQGIE